MKGMIGKKIGMTRVFDQNGVATAVTVIDASPNIVTQIKTEEKDGYQAVQVGFEKVKESRTAQPQQGHFRKAGVEPMRVLKEFDADRDGLNPGDAITVARFEPGQLVDVVGISKGKGFTGAITRWGFSRQPMSHGSMMHRRTGSIGGRNEPGRVFKNKKMPGHMGDEKITIQNLRVVQVRPDDNLILVKGAVPGANGSYLVVRDAVKGKTKVSKAVVGKK